MRLNPTKNLSPTPRRLLQIGVVAVLLAGLAGTLGYRALQRWRYAKAIRDTEDFMRLGDPRSAAFAAKRAAHLREDSPEAARNLAVALEKTDSVEAVRWRKKVVDLAPGDWRDHLAFAAAAMKFRDPYLAGSALEKVDAAGRQSIEYQRVAADVALALDKKVEAETALAEIVRLDPYDSQRKLQLAVIRLSSPDADKAVLARTQLEDMKDDPQQRLTVLRILVNEVTRANRKPELRLALSSLNSLVQSPLTNDPRLASLALELLAEPDATVTDCQVSLEVLRLLRAPEYQEKLARLETTKFDRKDAVGDVILWMNSRGLSAQALAWTERMPADVRAAPEVQLAIADNRMLARDWPAVQAMVEEAEWGDFDADRLVISAIVWRELDNSHRATAAWSLAELRIQQNVPRIQRLLGLCARWDAELESEKLSWLLSDCPGDQKAVLEKLFNLCLRRRDSNGLYRAVKGLYLRDRENPAAMNNYAWLSLLRNDDLETAHGLADQIFVKEPTVGPFVSTYAYSQHRRGRTAEAVAALAALKTSELENPTVAACYAYLLKAAGRSEEAAAYFGIARRSPDLLPEEARLFLETRETIDRSLEVPDLRIFATEP